MAVAGSVVDEATVEVVGGLDVELVFGRSIAEELDVDTIEVLVGGVAVLLVLVLTDVVVATLLVVEVVESLLLVLVVT